PPLPAELPSNLPALAFVQRSDASTAEERAEEEDREASSVGGREARRPSYSAERSTREISPSLSYIPLFLAPLGNPKIRALVTPSTRNLPSLLDYPPFAFTLCSAAPQSRAFRHG
ncbi:hypothetical protein KM043_000101, partial [Ampulex compressa]